MCCGGVYVSPVGFTCRALVSVNYSSFEQQASVASGNCLAYLHFFMMYFEVYGLLLPQVGDVGVWLLGGIACVSCLLDGCVCVCVCVCA
jgi:hypothetical protein